MPVNTSRRSGAKAPLLLVRAEVEEGADSLQQLALSTHVFCSARCHASLQYIQATPDGLVECRRHLRIGSQEWLDGVSGKLMNVTVCTCPSSGCVRRARQQANFAEVLSGSEATESHAGGGFRLTCDFYDPGGYDIQRRVRGSLGEQNLTRLEQTRPGATRQSVEIFGLQAFEYEQLA
jgi:hypothetical protein